MAKLTSLPDDPAAFLKLGPAELGQLLLAYVLEPGKENNRNNLNLAVRRKYPQQIQPAIEKALMEALAWLARRGLIADSAQGNGWFFVTKDGEDHSVFGSPAQDIAEGNTNRLEAVTTALDKTLATAIRRSWSIKDPNQRSLALSGLAKQLPPHERDLLYLEAIDSALTLADANKRQEALERFARELPPTVLPQFLEILKREPDEVRRIRQLRSFLYIFSL